MRQSSYEVKTPSFHQAESVNDTYSPEQLNPYVIIFALCGTILSTLAFVKVLDWIF